MNANEVERYLEIGRRNQEVIELGRNWCRHLEVELVGGVGMIEAQTGLPIGSRAFSCAHAAGGRFGGMHLDAIAVDFALRNCQDCRFRDVVGFPNWTSLIAERDRRRQEVRAQEGRRLVRDLVGVEGAHGGEPSAVAARPFASAVGAAAYPSASSASGQTWRRRRSSVLSRWNSRSWGVTRKTAK